MLALGKKSQKKAEDCKKGPSKAALGTYNCYKKERAEKVKIPSLLLCNS